MSILWQGADEGYYFTVSALTASEPCHVRKLRPAISEPRPSARSSPPSRQRKAKPTLEHEAHRQNHLRTSIEYQKSKPSISIVAPLIKIATAKKKQPSSQLSMTHPEASGPVAGIGIQARPTPWGEKLFVSLGTPSNGLEPRISPKSNQ